MEGVQYLSQKIFEYNIIFVEAENARVCPVLSKYDTTTIICIYMTNDINCDMYYEYKKV